VVREDGSFNFLILGESGDEVRLQIIAQSARPYSSVVQTPSMAAQCRCP
jgi:hypothetical protein